MIGLADNGARVLVIDAGIAEPAGFERTIDYTQHVVAERAGSTIEALRRRNDRGFAIATMAEGVAAVLSEQLSKDDLDGVFALGGSGGSSIAARAVRDLPVGLPKLIVSTMVSGDVSPYVGASDVTLMYSVVDIAGINQISRAVLGNAAAAITAMATARRVRQSERSEPSDDKRPLIGASMFGVTTPAVNVARPGSKNLVMRS